MKKRICLAVAAVLIAAIAIGVLWQQGYFLPGWISWQEGSVDADLGTVTVAHRRAAVTENGKTVFETEPGLRVQAAMACDIDRDGGQELLLLCWKRGRYGDSRPFWVKRDPKTWSQHIYLYDWTEAGIRPIWMASDLGREVVNWRFDEADRLVLTDRIGEQTAWDWLSWGLQNIPLRQRLTMAAVGDNLIHRQIYDYAFQHENGSFSWIYEKILPELSRYDLISVNQETPLVTEPGDYGTYPLFGTPIQAGQALVDAGFDLITCATNHALDRGLAGVDRTAAFFREAGVVCTGIQESSDAAYVPFELLEQNGITCAILSYTQSTNGIAVPADYPHAVHTLDDVEQVRADLRLARERADLVLVYVHWGTEYQQEPDEDQRYWAKIFADGGAHVVIGTHPHVLQPWQWVEGADGGRTLVYYSLGNLISAQAEAVCRVGGLAWFTAEKAGDTCTVTDCGLKELYTREQEGRYTVGLTP